MTRNKEHMMWTKVKCIEFHSWRISSGLVLRAWIERASMIGISKKMRKWFTRYWYPSLTYLSFTDCEKSGICGAMMVVCLFQLEENWGAGGNIKGWEHLWWEIGGQLRWLMKGVCGYCSLAKHQTKQLIWSSCTYN